MPNGQFNPLATLATSARQINEQANQAVKSLGDSFTQATSQLLTTAAQGMPPLPPLPGAQNNPGPRSNPGPFANGGGFPQLLPPQALQAVSQVEDVAFPAGFPKPTQVLGLRRARVAPQPAEQPAPASTPLVTAARPAAALGVEGQDGVARPRALGVQTV